MVFNIKGDDDLINAVKEAALVVVAAHRQAGMLNEDTLELSWGADPKPKKVAGPSDPAKARIKYRALLPAGTPEQVREIINQNIRDFGSVTVKARIYQDLVNAARRGDTLAEAEIRQIRELAKGTSQRVIGELVRNGFATGIEQ